MKRILALVVLLAAVLATACACSTPSSGHDETLAVTGGRVAVHVPADPTHIGVVVLHSYGHHLDEAQQQGWYRTSDDNGFVVLSPEHVSGSWNAGLCCGVAAASNVDDVAWLDATIKTLRVRYALTTIYLAGFSNGGMMVERLVAERPWISDRFAVWGAAPEMPTPGRWSGYGVLYDGANDVTVPWKGGTIPLFGGGTVVIRPSQSTAGWLVGAWLRPVIVPGYGHAPEPGWPGLAWAEISQWRAP